jgi:signal transduction histidine kinase
MLKDEDSTTSSKHLKLTRKNLSDLEEKNAVGCEDADEDAGQSADIFGELGDDIMPWKRVSSVDSASVVKATTSQTPTSAFLQRQKFELQNDVDREISDMTKSVYDSFDKRELMLKTSYTNTRFFMIENCSDTELVKYEMLLKEMRDRSILKDAEDIEIKLDTIDPMVGADNLRAKKIADIKTTWLMKVLKASEDHVNKSNLVRSMFRRTHDFFNDLNDMEYQYLTKKHMREIAKQDILHKLRVQADQSPHITERVNSMEITQQKELQWIQFKNIKEVYVRMVQKEWSAMDNHLSMLEELYQTLHKIYIEVMNLKIRHVNEWYDFRTKKDQSLRDAVRTLQDNCHNDFHAFKDTERRVEMTDVKQNAEEDRRVRFKSFTDAETVISSELVFGMTMKRQKALYILDDASSEATFDFDDDADATSLLEGKNAEFLVYVRKRMKKKAQIETKYNAMLINTTQKYQAEEQTHLESNRKQQREHMKTAMEKYFALEKSLSDKIQVFLTAEKQSIEQLKVEHIGELECVMHAHDLEFEKTMKLENKFQARLSRADSVTKESIATTDHQADTMITAHVFHEVRNVLASILCLGENMKENPARLDEILSEQCDICNYALDTMNDMLDVAKIKTSTYTVKQDVVNVSALFDEVIRLQGQRAKKGVMVVKVVEDEKLEIVTERRLLRQLLVNLVSNSTKFTVEGQITLYACAAFKGRVNCVKLGVADTGPGVSAGISTKINDESIANGNVLQGFIDTQSDLSSTLSDINEYTARSSGYGLYLASTVAKTLGGSLLVISPVKDKCPFSLSCPHLPGSFFYTILPCTVKPPKYTAVAPSPVAVDNGWGFAPTGTMSALIVDDQKLLRHSMISIFKKLCEQFNLTIDITTACSAEEALRKQKLKKYDIITLDEHYDQSVLARSTLSKKSATSLPPLRLSYKTTDTNSELCIAFKGDERFEVLPSDGVMLGTEAVPQLSKECTIIISCTGSPNVAHPYVITKPYTLERFTALMELHMDDFLTQKIVRLDGDVIRKTPQLALYKLRRT